MATPTNPFSQQAITQAVKDLPTLPENQVNIGMVATKDDQGAEIAAEKDWKNGLFVSGDASWWRTAGWKAAAWFGWKQK